MPQPTQPTKPVDPLEGLDPHEKELERKRQLLAKVRVVRESLLQRTAEVTGKNPNKAYSWINTHPTRINTFKAMGYEICKDPNIKSQWQQEDGSHVRGDAILMECDRELKEAWDLDSAIRATEAMEAPVAQFKEFAGRNGVPVTDSR